MARRLDGARSRMAAAGLDCLLISGIEDFCYFNGVPGSLYQQRRPWCAVIPIVGDPVVLTMKGIDETLEAEGFFKNVETYRLPVDPNFDSKVHSLLGATGASVVGCELGLEMRLGMPWSDFETIKSSLPSVTFVDASALIWDLRMVKSDEEAERIRRACQITGSTRQALFHEVRIGMTEIEVSALWAEMMQDAGADRAAFIFVSSGESIDLIPTQRKLKAGDTLWTDGGAVVRDYTCDFSRVATVGPASSRQKHLHADVVEVMTIMLDHSRSDVRVRDLSRICADEMTKRGYSDFSDPSQVVAGHGMGMLTNEPPLIAPWDDTVLVDGLVTGIEFGVVEPEGLFIWEDVIRVAGNGCERMSSEPWDLVEIDV